VQGCEFNPQYQKRERNSGIKTFIKKIKQWFPESAIYNLFEGNGLDTIPPALDSHYMLFCTLWSGLPGNYS
jgi:hypothetical protein